MATPKLCSFLIFIFAHPKYILKLHPVPSTEDVSTTKGKTWGPSTVHQRERSLLPNIMRSTATQSPQFSKSAPNLDKSRMATAAAAAANTSLIDIYKADSLGNVDQSSMYPHHHKSTLGKSEEVLSQLTTPKSKRKGVVKSRAGVNNANGICHSFDDDDDDDYAKDEVSSSGCFPFINRSDDTSSRSIYQGEPRSRKKLSIDSSSYQLISSPIKNNNNNNNDIPHPNNHGTIMSGYKRPNLDDVIYDRAFYRENQKSLDNVFAKYDEQQQSLANLNNKRNSRSSTVLTYNDYDEEIEYSSKFDRKCFFTENQTELENDFSESNNNDTFQSTDQSSSQIDESMYLEDHFQRSLALNSSNDSRKNSVTFRSDVESMDDSMREDLVKDLLIDTASNPASIYTSKQPVCNGVSSSSTGSLKSALRRYPVINSKHSQSLSTSSTSTSLKEKNYMRTRISRFFKRKSKDRNASSHSNSFYMKLDRFSGVGELNEQLLAAVTTADELDHHNVAGHRNPVPFNGDFESYSVANLSSSSPFANDDGGQTIAPLSADEAEPQYDAIFKTTHFLLARHND